MVNKWSFNFKLHYLLWVQAKMLSEKGYFAVLELILICMGEDGKRSIRKCSQSCKGLPLNLIRVEEIVPCPGCSQPWNFGLEGRDCYVTHQFTSWCLVTSYCHTHKCMKITFASISLYQWTKIRQAQCLGCINLRRHSQVPTLYVDRPESECLLKFAPYAPCFLPLVLGLAATLLGDCVWSAFLQEKKNP